MYSFFLKRWREALGTRSPSFPISSAKCLSLFLWYLWNYCSSMSELFHWGNLACPWSNTIGFIRIGFTNWDLWSFSQGSLLQDSSEQRSFTDWHMSLFHILGLKRRPQNVAAIHFLKHLQEFHLDLCSPIYSNSPQVSCLGMNSGKCLNHNFKGSYLL